MPNDFRARALRVIADEVGIGVAVIADSDRLDDDLGLDSLDRIELLQSCEEEFGAAALPDAIIAAETVGEFLALLDAALAQEAADA